MKQDSSIDLETLKEMQRLVDRTGSLLPWRRKMARAALLALGRDAVDPLLALYHRYERSRRDRSTVSNCLAGGMLAFACASILGLWATRNEFWTVMVNLALLSLIVVPALGSMQSLTRRQALLANALALYDDLRVIGPLAQALRFKPGSSRLRVKTREQAMATLTSLLPRLTGDAGDMLDATQRDCLRRELVSAEGHPIHGPHCSFKLAILAGLEAIGDTGALPYVRRLAVRYERLPAADLKRAIRHCLRTLEAIAEQERQSQTLLRASAADRENPQTVLLRAARGGPAVEPQQLLRATEENVGPI